MIKLTEEQRIKNCLKRHPDWKETRVANSANAHIELVRYCMKSPSDLSAEIKTDPEIKAPKSNPGIISLEKIKLKFDITSLIMAELVKLPRGRLISEQELSQRVASLDRQRFRRTLDNNIEQFRLLRIKLKLDEGEGRWFWGHIDDIAEALRMRDL